MKTIQRLSVMSAACALFGLHATAQAQFVTIPVAGGATTALTACNPKPSSATLTTCKVTGLPGSAAIPGYILKSSTSSSILVGGSSTNVGTLYDRVYCKGTGTTCDSSNTYILATRANLNTNVWSGTTTASFEINDFFRTVRSAVSVDVAYFMPGGGSGADNAQAFKYLEYTGRTVKGLNEPSPNSNTKTTNNNWIAFRADTNANDPDGGTSAWSPWLLVRQVCPTGYNTTPQALKGRLWQGGEEGQPPQEILKSVYVCN